jgi:hypothetical protein
LLLPWRFPKIVCTFTLAKASIFNSDPPAANLNNNTLGNWISSRNTKLLRLHLEYQPSCFVFQDNVVVLGLRSGLVKIIEFQEV